RAIRNIRAEAGVDPGRKVEAIFLAAADQRKILAENSLYLQTLAGLSKMDVQDSDADKPGKAMTAVVEGVEIYLPLAGMVDLELELKRLQKEQVTLEEERNRLTGKLANEQFVAKAPPAVVEKERKKLSALETDYAKVCARLAELAE
ncbi:MAG TPA: valine--tRNA ligase, partial [Firmicutes bacterium]|nr:valine--tRNA ligase [Bacillota bacterium]